jgi:hypothetical protein
MRAEQYSSATKVKAEATDHIERQDQAEYEEDPDPEPGSCPGSPTDRRIFFCNI